jgi:lambda repressor-like predicted transcriptional regulator
MTTLKQTNVSRKERGEKIQSQINKLGVSLRKITITTGLSYDQIRRVINGDNYEIDTYDRLTDFLKGI